MPANRGFTDEAQPSLETRLLLGALAGVVGTAAMTVAMRALHRRLPPQHRYPLPPREIVQEVLPEPAGHRIAEDHRQSLTMAAHFGYGAATAALYAAARPPPSAGVGALYGVLVWGASYLGWIPGADILKPATQHPGRRNALMIACHLVWGATMATTLRELQRANAEIFAGNAIRDAAPDGSYRRRVLGKARPRPGPERQQVPLSSDASALQPALDAARNDKTHEVLPDLAYRRLGIVNVVFFGPSKAGDRGWVLIDAGLPGTKGLIKNAAAERFGSNARPAAIIMTHGHFDHVGALEDLADEWDAPVYAHPLELPYLSGRASYPPGDPSVGGGLMAALTRLYPRGPVNVGARLQPLPDDGTLPGMPGWRHIHTPGHSVGHASFWRHAGRTLIVGDAFVTTAQESAYAVAVQRPEMHGPPMYYTVAWDKAGGSVARLAELEPELVITGHGVPMRGPEMRTALDRLAREFDRVAVPQNGKYLRTPARAEDGSAYCDPGT